MMRLYNFDSMQYLHSYRKSLRVDAVITDPEYDMDFTWYKLCREVCPTGVIIGFCKPENEWPNPDEKLYWVKPLSTKNFTRKCGRFVEVMCVYRGDWSTFNVLHWSQMTGCYMDLIEEKTVHPWQKPLSLMKRLVKIYTKPGDLVLDPFMGSGSTGEACGITGRNFMGLETNEEYFDLAVNRLSPYN